MSEIIGNTYADPTRTVFENAWDQEDNPNLLFRSKRYGIMALADLYPKMVPQAVIAPKNGKKGEIVHVHDLPPDLRLRMHYTADAIAKKLQDYMDELGLDKYSITHTEGRGVKDHAHIVVAAGEQKEGLALYTGESLGEDAVRRTVEILKFNDIEAARLNQELGRISVWL